MQAIAIERFGGPDELALVELPEPRLPPDALLIRTRAAALNPVDTKIRAGALEGRFPCFFPLVPGWDVAGVVERAGPAVRGFAPGDEVIAYCRKDFIQEGTYAEQVVVRARQAAQKPRSLSFGEASGLPLAGLTAYQAIYDALELQPGETMLVNRAAGGVGCMAVQLGRILGARVIGVASSGKHDLLRDLGASQCIDYRETDPIDAVREAHPEGIDAVFDLIGGETVERSAQVLRAGGRVVSIVQPPDADAFARQDVSASYIFVLPDGDELRALARLAEGGELVVPVERTLPLSEARAAHELIEDGHVSGKLVLAVGG
jgi:NADPH:quinone reductase-like Zn-dependent oxidoreductase